MIKTQNSNKRAAIKLVALGHDGQTLDVQIYDGNHEPSLLLLDFVHNTNDAFMHQVRQFLVEITYITLCVFFLSSAFCVRVEAHSDFRTSITAPVNDAHSVYDNWIGDFPSVYGAIDGLPSRSAFEKQNASLNYLVIWPHLPSVTDMLIIKANDNLKLFMAAEAERKAVKLRINWEDMWRGLGLLAILAGLLVITVVHGKWTDLKQ